VRLDGDALSLPVDRCPQVQRRVRGQQHGLQQPVDVQPAPGGDVDEHGVAAVLLRHQAVLGELLAYLVGVRLRLVDLVDRHHDRYVGRLGMVERLDGLRHHAVVRGHHQDHDVRGLGTTGTHGGERLVTRGVDEGDRPILARVPDVDLVGADVLGDPAGLALDHVARPDGVQQLGLAVVDVTHHGHHRRPGDQPVLVDVRVEVDVEAGQQLPVLLLAGDDLHIEAQVLAEQQQRLVGTRLGRGHHLAQVEHLLDQRARVGVDPLGKVRQRGATRQPDRLALPTRGTRTHRRGRQVVELLPALLLRLAAAGRLAAGTPEGTRRAAAASTPPGARTTGAASRGTGAGTRAATSATAGATAVTTATATAAATAGAAAITAATTAGAAAARAAAVTTAATARTAGTAGAAEAATAATGPAGTGRATGRTAGTLTALAGATWTLRRHLRRAGPRSAHRCRIGPGRHRARAGPRSALAGPGAATDPEGVVAARPGRTVATRARCAGSGRLAGSRPRWARRDRSGSGLGRDRRAALADRSLPGGLLSLDGSRLLGFERRGTGLRRRDLDVVRAGRLDHRRRAWNRSGLLGRGGNLARWGRLRRHRAAPPDMAGGAGAACAAGAGATAGAAPPASNDARSRRATGASTVLDADFTYSPSS